MNLFKRISPFRTIIGGFALLILLGALLLCLPFASRSGEATPFFDSLFTAVSATCVTGLVVVDTATHWSLFGQGVILALIQIGGIGVVTLAMSVSLLAGKKIGLSERYTMQESVNAPGVGGIVRFTGFLLKTVFLIEGIGTLLLLPPFLKDFGAKGIWYALFHSISAFCNAGFDLLGEGAPFSSLTRYAADPWVNFVIIGLIVSGGLGFLTWKDVVTHRHRLKKYSMQSKVILLATALLVTVPALYFFFAEFSALPPLERLFGSLFQSVTARTAGFNTVDQTLLSEAGVLVMCLLMLVGGAPGSTAGGMKTTTLALCLSTALCVFRRRNSPGFFKRRVAEETVRTAMAILVLYFLLFLISGCVISRVEGLPLMTCLFETGSAIATVGITLGVTSSLSVFSRSILIFLMFFGRVGGLTMIYAAVRSNANDSAKYPVERIAIG